MNATDTNVAPLKPFRADRVVYFPDRERSAPLCDCCRQSGRCFYSWMYRPLPGSRFPESTRCGGPGYVKSRNTFPPEPSVPWPFGERQPHPPGTLRIY